MSETEKKEWVDWQNTKVLQKAVVIDEEDNLLCIKRTEEGSGKRKGMWDLPGGSIGPEDLVEGSKPNIEAIKREIKEETGLDAEDIEAVFVDSWVFERSPGKILGLAIGYRARVKGIKPQVHLSHEHTDSRWGSKDEVLSLEFGDDGGLHPSIIHRV